MHTQRLLVVSQVQYRRSVIAIFAVPQKYIFRKYQRRRREEIIIAPVVDWQVRFVARRVSQTRRPFRKARVLLNVNTGMP